MGGFTWGQHAIKRHCLAVITLNCNVGDRGAAEEAARLKPDIILFQESPGRAQLEALARKFFDDNGGVVHGVDASIVAHGKVVPAELSASLRSFFVQARVILPSGITVEVISTRLVPAVFRADLWSPSCWRAQAENRRTRRAQLRAIGRQIEAIPDGIPVILGGDFNAPQGDAVFRLLKPRLHDGFANAGRGWGDTITNDVPFLRIDQVWTSRELQMVRVVTRKTTHSDHRMVICDMALSHGARRPRTYTRQPPMENSARLQLDRCRTRRSAACLQP